MIRECLKLHSEIRLKDLVCHFGQRLSKLTGIPASADPSSAWAPGFTLIEVMIALVILTFGLLAAGQMMYISLGSGSLARSIGNASMAAQNKLEYLADLYRRDWSATDLTIGGHGPQQVQVLNPANGGTLNLYNVSWIISNISDPRPSKVLAARMVTVTVTPIRSGGTTNKKASLNKVVNVTSIFSPRTQ